MCYYVLVELRIEEYLRADGWKEEYFPVVQPVLQKRIWERCRPGDGPEKLRRWDSLVP